MTTIIRTVATGKVLWGDDIRDPSILQDRLSADTAIDCTGVTLEPNFGGDPDNDRLTLEFNGSPIEATVDATLAAFPLFQEPISGIVAVTPNNPYVVHTQTVQVGEVWGFDIHLLVAFGTQANLEVSALDQYTAVWRRTAGNVRVLNPEGATPGTIPGLRLDVESDATTATILLKLGRAGNLYILEREVEILGYGRIS